MPIFMEKVRPSLEAGLEVFEGLHGIVDPRRTLRHESLAELGADQETEVPGAGLDHGEEALLRKERLRLRRLRVVKLARIGADRGVSLLHGGRDIDHESRRV